MFVWVDIFDNLLHPFVKKASKQSPEMLCLFCLFVERLDNRYIFYYIRVHVFSKSE